MASSATSSCCAAALACAPERHGGRARSPAVLPDATCHPRAQAAHLGCPCPTASWLHREQQLISISSPASGAAGYRNATDLNNIERRSGRDAVRVSTLRRLRDAYAGAKETPEYERLHRLVDGDLMWDVVVSVRDTGVVERVFDLEVRPNGRRIENFLGGHGGVFVSNTAGFVDRGLGRAPHARALERGDVADRSVPGDEDRPDPLPAHDHAGRSSVRQRLDRLEVPGPARSYAVALLPQLRLPVTTDVGRCSWAGTDPLMVAYHDDEWGVPDARRPPSVRAAHTRRRAGGLELDARSCNKREGYRAAFAGFDRRAVAAFDDATWSVSRRRAHRAPPRQDRVDDQQRACGPRGAGGARQLRRVRVVVRRRHARSSARAHAARPAAGSRPPSPPRSARTSSSRGFRFVGPTTVYAFMQAAGLADDHVAGCFRR